MGKFREELAKVREELSKPSTDASTLNPFVVTIPLPTVNSTIVDIYEQGELGNDRDYVRSCIPNAYFIGVVTAYFTRHNAILSGYSFPVPILASLFAFGFVSNTIFCYTALHRPKSYYKAKRLVPPPPEVVQKRRLLAFYQLRERKPYFTIPLAKFYYWDYVLQIGRHMIYPLWCLLIFKPKTPDEHNPLITISEFLGIRKRNNGEKDDVADEKVEEEKEL